MDCRFLAIMVEFRGVDDAELGFLESDVVGLDESLGGPPGEDCLLGGSDACLLSVEFLGDSTTIFKGGGGGSSSASGGYIGNNDECKTSHPLGVSSIRVCKG
jgi:hypothetical protein